MGAWLVRLVNTLRKRYEPMLATALAALAGVIGGMISINGDNIFLSEERIPVYHSGFTQVEATLLLLRGALGRSQDYVADSQAACLSQVSPVERTPNVGAHGASR